MVMTIDVSILAIYKTNYMKIKLKTTYNSSPFFCKRFHFEHNISACIGNLKDAKQQNMNT